MTDKSDLKAVSVSDAEVEAELHNESRAYKIKLAILFAVWFFLTCVYNISNKLAINYSHSKVDNIQKVSAAVAELQFFIGIPVSSRENSILSFRVHRTL